MTRCANISRFDRGGTKWASSHRGSSRALRRSQSSIKHRRLRYLLLLSLRALLLLLLALAFANPFINRTAAGMNGEKLQLLGVDNSFSMRAGTRLGDAKREA